MYVRVLVPTLDRYSKEEDSESLVDSLFEEKVKAGLWRYHPEFPQKKDWASFFPKYWTISNPCVQESVHSSKQNSTCPISLQEMRQVKVYDVEEEVSESEDEFEVATKITSVDDERNYEDTDDEMHLECIWISDLQPH